MSTKYSIIIPAYNAEKYIKQCLDSVIHLDYTDYEVFIWDDGSNDNTPSITDEYAMLNSNLSVRHEQNVGSGLARLNSLRYVTGRYVLFLDADDIISPNLFSTVDMVLDDNTDLLQFASISFYNDKQLQNYRQRYDLKPDKTEIEKRIITYDKTQFVDQVVRKTIINGTEAVVVWNKIYRLDLLKKNEGGYVEQMLEDYLMNMDYYQYVGTFKKIDTVLHYYRVLPNSLSKQVYPKWFEALILVQEYKTSFMKRVGASNIEDYDEAAYWFLRYLQSMIIKCVLSGQINDQTLYKIISNDMVLLCGERVQQKDKHDIFSKYLCRQDLKGLKRYFKIQGSTVRIKEVIKLWINKINKYGKN